jgi:hypothetical protein
MLNLRIYVELEPNDLPEAEPDPNLTTWFRYLFGRPSQEDQVKLERLDPIQKNWEATVGPFIIPYSVSVE